MSLPVFDAIFVPCLSPGSTCETSSGLFFGGQGVCNTQTGLCECSGGYTGVDDVAVYNDCHINATFRIVCHGVTLVLSALAAVVALAALGKLAVMWGVVSWAPHETDKQVAAEIDSADDNKTGGARTAHDRSEIRARTSDAHAPALRSPRAMVGPLFSTALVPSNSISSSAHTSTIAAANNNNSALKQPPSPPRGDSSTSGRKVGSTVALARSVSAPIQLMQPATLQTEGRVERSGSLSDGGEPHTSPTSDSPQRVRRKTSRAPRLSIKPMQQPKTNVRSASLVHDMSLAKRRRNTCLLVTGFAAHAVFAVAVVACFASYRYMAQRNAGLLVALALSLASFQMSLWVLAYSWCGSLQSMKGYARMFPHFASHPLMRFPWLPSTVTLLCLLASFAMCVAFFLALPLTVDQVQLQQWVVPVGLTLLATLVFTLTLFQSAVFSLLLRMFSSHADNASHQKTRLSPSPSSVGAVQSPSEAAAIGSGVTRKTAFVKARRTVLFVLILGCVSGPFVVVFLLIGAWTFEGRRHMYFFFSALFSLAAIIILGSTYIVVYRISSSGKEFGAAHLSPVTKTRKMTRHHSQGAPSRMTSSQQQGNNGSGFTGAQQGPLVLALRGGQSKGSTEVMVS